MRFFLHIYVNISVKCAKIAQIPAMGETRGFNPTYSDPDPCEPVRIPGS